LLRTLADGTVDTGAADTGAADTWAVDTGAEDTGAADTGATDTGVADTEAAQSRIVRCELLNVTHLVAQLADVSLSATSVAIGVHACNAASLELLNAARAAGSAWAVMPCCIPEKLYMPNTAVTLGIRVFLNAWVQCKPPGDGRLPRKLHMHCTAAVPHLPGEL